MGETGRKSILFIIGTRPEAIKLAPVIRAFQNDAGFVTRLCVTAQHREMLDQFLEFFGLRPDFDLNLMSPGQTLPALTSRIVAACADVFERLRPDLVFVQGDTISASAAAWSACLCGVPVAHVEAGLRSHRKDSPFPEEINRLMIGQLAVLHFAPGPVAAGNLRREGITHGVHEVGNPIVDALKMALHTIAEMGDASFLKKFPAAGTKRKILLVTLHRRESFGQPLENICAAVRRLAESVGELEVFFPVHPNPQVAPLVQRVLGGIENVRLLEPLSHADFVWLLSRTSVVISDSGGVLEEAETLGLPVLVAREVTERVEALDGGNMRLVGSDPERIYRDARELLAATSRHTGFRQELRHTFGDGNTAAHILRLTREHLAAVRPANGLLQA